MRKQSEHLFKIGEIAKILGVTRKTILVYEEMGLLTPAVKDEASGYRYYTADNMTQIRAIRSLQTLGHHWRKSENITMIQKTLTAILTASWICGQPWTATSICFNCARQNRET